MRGHLNGVSQAKARNWNQMHTLLDDLMIHFNVASRTNLSHIVLIGFAKIILAAIETKYIIIASQ